MQTELDIFYCEELDQCLLDSEAAAASFVDQEDFTVIDLTARPARIVDTSSLVVRFPRQFIAQTTPPVARRSSRLARARQADLIRFGIDYKGQYARRTSSARVSITREGPLNKLIRYYTKEGLHTKAQGQVLSALSELYQVMLERPDHELIMRLGGYSPAVGHLIHATFMHNPNTLLAWIAKQHSQTYAYKCFYTTKHVRKRTKVRQNIHCVHVPREARLNQSLRALHFFTEEQKYDLVSQRMFFAVIDTIFSYKKGVLYQRKLRAYRTAFNKARQRQSS